MARIEKIPWGKPAEAGSSPWPGRSLALVFLVLAALIVFHESRGQHFWSDLSAAWQAQPTLNAPTSPVPSSGRELSAIAREVEALKSLLAAGRWTAADTSLDIIETNWDALVGRLARHGTSTDTLNRFTETLGRLAAAVSAKDAVSGRREVAALAVELQRLSGQAEPTPTFSELKALVRRLRSDLTADPTRLRRDAESLNRMVDRFQKGF